MNTQESSPPVPKLLNEVETARFLGISRSFLRRARMTGRTKSGTEGPPFVRLGPASIRYRLEDLEAWIAARRVAR